MPEYVLDTTAAPDIWRELDDFTRAYIEAAMWTLTDTWRECPECGYITRDDDARTCPECANADGERELELHDGEDRDDLGASDIAPEAIEAARRDCIAFQQQFRLLLDDAENETGRDDASHGHDFWLTRNDYGAGFWDRGYSDALGDALTEGAKGFGEVDWYVGDDGRVYQS